MSANSTGELEIRALTAAQWQQLRASLFSGGGSPELPPEALAPGDDLPKGLVALEARRHLQTVGVIVAQSLPGRVGVVFPPQLLPGESRETAIQLQLAVDRQMYHDGAQMLQVILPSLEVPQAMHLAQCGYQYLTDLSYLVSLTRDNPLAAPQGALTFQPYQAADRARLLRVVERTYKGTMDCPQLNGLRKTQDVLDGYGAVGDHPLWYLVHCRGMDVGCLLLAEHWRHNQLELVYMGIVPEMRGRGWGRQVTQHAQELARGAGRQRLVLAVDVANTPAQAAYTAAGFHAWARRSVLIKTPAAGV